MTQFTIRDLLATVARTRRKHAQGSGQRYGTGTRATPQEQTKGGNPMRYAAAMSALREDIRRTFGDELAESSELIGEDRRR